MEAVYSALTDMGAHRGPTGEFQWGSISEERQRVLGQAPCMAWLTDMRIAELSGEDVRQFLQGQLTNDVYALNPAQAQWQGYCQPQGRLLATFPLVCDSSTAFWIALPTTIAAAVVKRLSMFVLRAKVKITLTDDWIIGAVHSVDSPFIRVGATSVGVQRIQSNQLVESFSRYRLRHAAVSQSSWMAALIDNRVALIDSGAQDLFVPQMVGWDHVGVNFKKGCYPGQEVVARAHYRGSVKRKPAMIFGQGVPPAPGTPLLTSEDEIGHLVKACAIDSNQWASIAAIHQDHLQEAQRPTTTLGPINIKPL